MPRSEERNTSLETLIRRNLFMWITLPMELRQPPTELFFRRDDRGCDRVSRVFKFLLQSRSLRRTTIEFNEMIGV
jgi:hypothetical protein